MVLAAYGRLVLATIQVRCLGEMGWCMGAAIGAFLGFLVVGALTNALLAIVGLPWAR
jgi:hypothetical protein